MGIQGPSPTATHRGARVHGVSGARAHGVSRDLTHEPVRTGSVRPVDTGVPWARYTPVRTRCSSANFLGSPWARGFGGPCARGHLGLPVLLLLCSVLVRVALGWSSFSLVMLLSFMVVFLFVPNEK